MTKPTAWLLSPSPPHPDRFDALVAGTLALTTLLTRLPFRTTMLYNWDSANFALATRAYDVTQHHPHPPGYFLYVALGNLLLPLVGGDANAALVTVSLLLSVAAPPLVYLLGATVFNRLVGLGGGLFLLTSVTFWSYGGLALAYPALAVFSTWVAWSAYRTTWQRDAGAWLPLAVAYGVGAGFRPDVLFLLGPIWLAGLLGLGWRRRLATLAVAGALVAGWLVPTIALSGGVGKYLAVLHAYTDRDVLDRYSSTRGGVTALLSTVRDLVSYTWYALYALVVPLVAGVGAVLVWRPRPDRRWLFFLIWLAPLLLFYVVIHIGDPGYVFTFLPALAVLASQAVVALTCRFARWQAVTLAVGTFVVIAVVNSAVFLFYPRVLTAPGIRESDRQLAAKIAAIRALPNDGTTLLLSYDSYRHLQYYLPEWRSSLWVDPFAGTPQRTTLAPETRWIVLVDDRLRHQTGTLPGATSAEAGMTRVPVRPGQTLTFGAGVLSLE